MLARAVIEPAATYPAARAVVQRREDFALWLRGVWAAAATARA